MKKNDERYANMITLCFCSRSWNLVCFSFLCDGSKLFWNVSTTALYGMEVEKGED